MPSKCSNIYKTARNAAHLTQEQAAQLLFISPRSVIDYESGKTIPSDEVVCKMIEIYNSNRLAWLHLKNSTEVGRKYLPEISFTDLPMSVLNFEKEMDDINDVERMLRNIACDGVIDGSEIAKWRKVRKEVMEVVTAGIAVIFAR